jgi:hypothetical protein
MIRVFLWLGFILFYARFSGAFGTTRSAPPSLFSFSRLHSPACRTLVYALIAFRGTHLTFMAYSEDRKVVANFKLLINNNKIVFF